MIARTLFPILYFVVSSFLLRAESNPFEKIIESTDPYINIGVQIVHLESNKTIFAKNENRFFVPASLTKIFTCVAALKKLGSDYQFLTKLYQKGDDWYLEFSGDPTFKFDDLRNLLESIKKISSTIKGNIYIVRPHIELPFFSEGCTVSSTQFCYAPPFSLITINNNSFQFDLEKAKGKSIKVVPGQGQISLPITNDAYIGKCQAHNQIERSDLSLNHDLTVKGCVKKGDLPLKICLPVLPHHFDSFIEQNIRQSLKSQKIKFDGKISFTSTLPTNLLLQGQHSSSSLKIILQQGMKESHNPTLNAMILPLIKDARVPIRKWKDATQKIVDILESRLDVDLQGIALTEPSGLSYFNLITPAQITQVLVKSIKDEKIGGDFLEMLPVPNQEGTLKNRFSKIPNVVKVWAKTGSLSSGSGLAGFIGGRDSKPKYAFVIMINGIASNHETYKKLEEHIIEEISRRAA